MDELSYLDKMNLATELLLDPISGKAAAYSYNHRLVAEEASPRLIAYLREHATSRMEPWDESRWDPASPWRPMPAWATATVRERCVILRADLDYNNVPELLAMPPR